MNDEFFVMTLNLNARLQPFVRDKLEDAVNEMLEKANIGETDGGGTLMEKSGEISECDVFFNLRKECFDNDLNAAMEMAVRIVSGFGYLVPQGSSIICEGVVCKVGTAEGLALYLDGVNLEEKVYKECSTDHIIEEMEKRFNGKGHFMSHWTGAEETALYFYGDSYDEMYEIVDDFAADYPLCENCRIIRIA